ncbi:hypothetical protein D3C77_624060 [compost metagenome]
MIVIQKIAVSAPCAPVINPSPPYTMASKLKDIGKIIFRPLNTSPSPREPST